MGTNEYVIFTETFMLTYFEFCFLFPSLSIHPLSKVVPADVIDAQVLTSSAPVLEML